MVLPPIDWPLVLGVLTALSAGLLLVAAVALPRVLATLPADYLQHDAEDDPVPPPGVALARNALAAFLVVAGVAMLVLPGQGVLTILAGLVVSTVRGKRRVVHWLLAQPAVVPAVQWVRRRAGAEPLRLPREPVEP